MSSCPSVCYMLQTQEDKAHFLQAMVNALMNRINNRATFTGHLETYRYCDNVNIFPGLYLSPQCKAAYEPGSLNAHSSLCKAHKIDLYTDLSRVIQICQRIC